MRRRSASSRGPETVLGYWADLGTFQFDEGDDATTGWIQALPFGTWHHPVHGKVEVDMQRAQRFAANINAGVRGQELDIDYDHKILRTDAAGWVKKAEVRSGPQGGLWWFVEWTKEAAQKIKDKAFKYFSPEFQDVWEHPVTKRKIRDVAFGGALTNRPFLKGILPINLSELTEDNNGGEMNRAFLEIVAKGLGVKFDDDTSDDELQTMVTTAAAAADSDPSQGGEGDENDGGDDDDGNGGDGEGDESGDQTSDKEPVLASEQLKKLAEENPVVAMLLDEREQNNKRIAMLEAANHMSTVSQKLSELDTTNSKRRLSPAAKKKLSDLAVGLPRDKAESLIEAAKAILGDGGIVQLGETSGAGSGKGGSEDATGGDATKRFSEAVQKLMDSNDKLDYADAVERVSAEDPELFEDYRTESFAFVEGVS